MGIFPDEFTAEFIVFGNQTLHVTAAGCIMKGWANKRD